MHPIAEFAGGKFLGNESIKGGHDKDSSNQLFAFWKRVVTHPIFSASTTLTALVNRHVFGDRDELFNESKV